jgi:hypothetical protein
MRSSSAAGWVGAAVLGSSAAIELARAWTRAPGAAAEASDAMGGIVVAVLIVAAFAVATRARALANVAVAAGFVLVAHGGTLVLDGQTVGSLFLGIAPVAAVLSHAAFTVESAERREEARAARMLALWNKTSRRRTAPAARPVASPIPLAMRASQATIIDA